MAFGSKLERQRFAFLDWTKDSRHALLLGEGDGRYLLQLAKQNPSIEIDIVEASSAMIARARQRLHGAQVSNPGRIHFHQGDVRSWEAPGAPYDLVVSNFFFDCFSMSEVRQLVAAIRARCAPSARWSVAEFNLPAGGWRHWHARIWLATMYWFFRRTTGLQVRKLPAYGEVLAAAGFSLHSQQHSMASLISAELWRLTPES